MKVFHSPQHLLHAPDWYVADGTVRPCPETPDRAQNILKYLQEQTAHEIVALPPIRQQGTEVQQALEAALAKVHAADYLHYLRTIHGIWTAEFAKTGSQAVLPETFPRRLPHMTRPSKPAAQAGYYCFDMAAPIMAGTADAAVASAHAAMAAAQALLDGERSAYALCRPPGHHAGADYCGGFCYLNNVAIAAQHLRNAGMKKVAILDVDYHHGNGTQDIFYARSDVLFVSIHADPNTQYPYFWGHAGETGVGEGDGFTLNLPLAREASNDLWFAALDTALARIAEFEPEAILVSLGVDISRYDPVGDFHFALEDFARLRETLAARGPYPTAFVQEGGYHLEAIGPGIAAVLGAARS